MNSKRRSTCYNIIADAGYERRDWDDCHLERYLKSEEFKMELACKIDWESLAEMIEVYKWCMRKFFDSPADDDLYN